MADNGKLDFDESRTTLTIDSINEFLDALNIPEKDSVKALVNYFSTNGGDFEGHESGITVQARIGTVRGMQLYYFIKHFMGYVKNNEAVRPLVERIYSKVFFINPDLPIEERANNKSWEILQKDVMLVIREYAMYEFRKNLESSEQ
ncbi:MAG: hypothetical protein ABI721_02825 [Candidatus Dojkabacteria bacterium]